MKYKENNHNHKSPKTKCSLTTLTDIITTKKLES